MINKIKNNKILLFLSFLIIGILLFLVFRITYAYLADYFEEEQAKATINSSKVDELNFEESTPLNLTITAHELPEGSTNNISITSSPKVTLTANSTTKSATYDYYVYLDLTNTVKYTTDAKTPEVLLTVEGPNNAEIMSLPDENENKLSYKTENGVHGFDITELNGQILIAHNTINSTSPDTPTEQTWKFTITYLNLPSDQSANLNKSINSTIIISKDKVSAAESH